MDIYSIYAEGLLKKGICPENLDGDIIKLCTEDQEKCTYDFSLDNIVAGPAGELIKIYEDRDTVEIYNTLVENSYNVKIFSISTGKSLEDGGIWVDTNEIDSITLFGYDTFNRINNMVGVDYSECLRSINEDRDMLDLRMLEFKADDLRPRLSTLKENLNKILRKNCRKDDAICEGINELIRYIDEANKIHSSLKQIKTSELSKEMQDIINRKLKMDNLRREVEMESKISMTPINSILEEYAAYKTPKTNKLLKKFTYISMKVADAIRPFESRRIYLSEHLVGSEKTKKIENRKKELILQRKRELESNTWGSNYDF